MGDREFLPGMGNSGLALINILVVRPVDRTSCNRVARSNKSGKLVKLPRLCCSATAAIFNLGGRGLTRPDELLDPSDSLELDGDGDGVSPILGNGAGEYWTPRYCELGSIGELCIRGPPGVLGLL
jgi:hypothetical protein